MSAFNSFTTVKFDSAKGCYYRPEPARVDTQRASSGLWAAVSKPFKALKAFLSSRTEKRDSDKIFQDINAVKDGSLSLTEAATKAKNVFASNKVNQVLNPQGNHSLEMVSLSLQVKGVKRAYSQRGTLSRLRDFFTGNNEARNSKALEDLNHLEYQIAFEIALLKSQ